MDSLSKTFGSGVTGVGRPVVQNENQDFDFSIGSLYHLVSTASGPVTGTIPDEVALDSFVFLGCESDISQTNPLIIVCNDTLIEGSANNYIQIHPDASLVLQKVGGSTGWKIIDGIGVGGITTIWTGSAGDGVTVDWSGTGYTLSQFDAILLVGTGGVLQGPATIPPSLILGGTGTWVCPYDGAGDYTYVDTVTETSLVAHAGGTNGMRAIYGINYK